MQLSYLWTNVEILMKNTFVTRIKVCNYLNYISSRWVVQIIENNDVYYH